MEVVEGTSPGVEALAVGNSEADTIADHTEAVHTLAAVEGSPDSSFQAPAAEVSGLVLRVCMAEVVLSHSFLIIVSDLLY